jgi:hypothetical protein
MRVMCRRFLFALKLSLAVVAGCKSASVETTEVAVHPMTDVTMTVLPVGVASTTKGTVQANVGVIPLLLAPDAYTWKFGESDCAALRASLVQSLAATKSFAAVRPGGATPGAPASERFLRVVLTASSVEDKKMSGTYATLDGVLALEDGRGAVVRSRLFHVTGHSLLSEGGCKEDAIAGVVREAATLLDAQ